MSSKKKENVRSICLPGSETWEVWQSDGGSYSLVETAPPLAEGGSPASFKSASTIGVPVMAAFSIPLWVASDDPALIRSALEIQLETLGLKPEVAEGEHVDAKIVAQEEKRTLVSVTVLPDRDDLQLPKQLPERYEASPNLFVLPDNQIVVWRELGKLVVAITRGDNVVYFQGMTSPVLDSQAAHEISCVIMQLQSQGVVAELEGIALWLERGEAEEAALDRLRTSLGTTVSILPHPGPAEPLKASEWLPRQVAESHRMAKQRAQIRKIAIAAAAVYTGLVIVFAAKIFMKKRDLTAREAKVEALQPQTGWIPAMKLQWNELQQTIDPDTYPIETLRRIYSLMPPSGVRFTSYTDSISRVTIVGEAQDTNAATVFQNAIKYSKDLERYDWKGLPPRVGRNRTATFTYTGTLKDAELEN